jgi:MFS superfamily sulfate permease-like transporter
MEDKSGWIRWLPGLLTLRRYQVAWLPRDVVAGIVLATMLVPVGIAYAIASGLPGIYGLYATIVPLLAYALFGPSRILVLGPDSSLAAVILGVVLAHSGGDPGRAVALAGMMAVVSGIVCILAGIARLGFVTELLSKPIRYGYMNGIALTVLISQLPKFFGLSVEDNGPLRELWAIGSMVLHGKANWAAFAIGAGTLTVILLFKKHTRFPGILVAVVGATAIVALLNLDVRANVSVLGPLPQGLPIFAVPWIAYNDIIPVLIGGGAVALISFADTSVSFAYLCGAPRHKRRPQPGNSWTWSRQSGRRVFSRLSNQQQFITNTSGGGCGRSNAVDRCSRCTCRCSHTRVGAEPAQEFAICRLGGRCGRLGYRVV